MEPIKKHHTFLSGTKARRCALLIGLISFIYLVDIFSPLKGSFWGTYVIRPLLWAGVAVTVWSFPRARPAGKLRLHKYLNMLAFVCAVSYIMVMIMGGMVIGFGKSPYSFTPFAILFNIILVGSLLGGQELSRAYLINSLSAKRPFLIISIISLFFAFINIPFMQLLQFKSFPEAAKFAGNNALPLITENIMTSYFAYLGGPVTALVYQGTLQAFQWFCPILPNLGWVSKTLLGTFVPFISLIIVQQLYIFEARELRRVGRNKEGYAGWIVTCIAAVLLIWFAAGVFPIYPSVIATGSMEPLIKPGDVILVKKMQGQEVQPGDVIQYRHEEISITHRVVAIKGEERYIETKGDNNDSVDAKLVEPWQVKGKVIRIIPKIGWPTLFLKSQGAPDTANITIQRYFRS